ncbi:MAG TPA: hemolysin family protein [Dehalococcoidia bacterium]|jgi:CBS domain containing-hemolysin-like protein|nr:hemolysin family protein [Dehalococcoidia bacterium]
MDDALSISLRLLLVVALVLLNGLFVSAEFSIVAVRRTRIATLAEEGKPFYRLVLRAIDNVNNYLAATQLGITIASIGLGFVGEPVLADIIEPLFEDVLGKDAAGISSHAVAVPAAFALITSLHIVLGELAPKSVALFRSERIALATVPPTEVFRIVFWPAIWLLNTLANSALRPFGLSAPEGGAHSVHTAEEINLLVSQSAQAGLLEEEEAELITGVFSFGDRRVNEVMVPRTEVRFLPRDGTVHDFYRVYLDASHSRFPVFEGTHDNVVGIVNIKDVLRGLADGSLHEGDRIDLAMRSPLFVPETKFVGACFFQMQQAGQQMAIVVDEYGGTAGIVTLEMLLEELVGYVSDELRRHEEEFVEVAKNTFQVDAGMTIHDANEELELDLPEDEDYETIAGFVLAELGHIPAEGEEFVRDGISVKVTKVDGNRIEEVTITRR